MGKSVKKSTRVPIKKSGASDNENSSNSNGNTKSGGSSSRFSSLSFVLGIVVAAVAMYMVPLLLNKFEEKPSSQNVYEPTASKVDEIRRHLQSDSQVDAVDMAAIAEPTIKVANSINSTLGGLSPAKLAWRGMKRYQNGGHVLASIFTVATLEELDHAVRRHGVLTLVCFDTDPGLADLNLLAPSFMPNPDSPLGALVLALLGVADEPQYFCNPLLNLGCGPVVFTADRKVMAQGHCLTDHTRQPLAPLTLSALSYVPPDPPLPNIKVTHSLPLPPGTISVRESVSFNLEPEDGDDDGGYEDDEGGRFGYGRPPVGDVQPLTVRALAEYFFTSMPFIGPLDMHTDLVDEVEVTLLLMFAPDTLRPLFLPGLRSAAVNAGEQIVTMVACPTRSRQLFEALLLDRAPASLPRFAIMGPSGQAQVMPFTDNVNDVEKIWVHLTGFYHPPHNDMWREAHPIMTDSITNGVDYFVDPQLKAIVFLRSEEIEQYNDQLRELGTVIEDEGHDVLLVQVDPRATPALIEYFGLPPDFAEDKPEIVIWDTDLGQTFVVPPFYMGATSTGGDGDGGHRGGGDGDGGDGGGGGDGLLTPDGLPNEEKRRVQGVEGVEGRGLGAGGEEKDTVFLMGGSGPEFVAPADLEAELDVNRQKAMLSEKKGLHATRISAYIDMLVAAKEQTLKDFADVLAGTSTDPSAPAIHDLRVPLDERQLFGAPRYGDVTEEARDMGSESEIVGDEGKPGHDHLGRYQNLLPPSAHDLASPGSISEGGGGGAGTGAGAGAAGAGLCTIRRVDAREMDVTRFKNEFERPGFPVIIEGATDDWTAMNWLDSDSSSGDHYEDEATETLKNVLGHLMDVAIENGEFHTEMRLLGFQDGPSSSEDPDLRRNLRDAIVSGYTPPAYLAGEDLLAVCDRAELRDSRLAIAGAGAGAGWAVDMFNMSSWEALVKGRKRVALYPPTVGRDIPGPGMAHGATEHESNLVAYNEDGEMVHVWSAYHVAFGNPGSENNGHVGSWGLTSPYSRPRCEPQEYFESVFPGLKPGLHPETRHAAADGSSSGGGGGDVSGGGGSGELPLQCMLAEGEILYVPSGWWSLSLATTPSLAIVESRVTLHDLPQVLGELDKRLPPDTSAMCAHVMREVWGVVDEQTS